MSCFVVSTSISATLHECSLCAESGARQSGSSAVEDPAPRGTWIPRRGGTRPFVVGCPWRRQRRSPPTFGTLLGKSPRGRLAMRSVGLTSAAAIRRSDVLAGGAAEAVVNSAPRQIEGGAIALAHAQLGGESVQLPAFVSRLWRERGEAILDGAADALEGRRVGGGDELHVAEDHVGVELEGDL